MSLINNPIISIVVPVYKVEEYLSECINSVLLQTFTDYELILVDDGSPDRCGLLCDEYAKKDKRIRVIHKRNGGLSDARNKGINAAKGKYITFIDSDDYIDSAYLEYLFKCAESTNADIVQANYSSQKEKVGSIAYDRAGKSFSIKQFGTREAITDFLLYQTLYANAWAKIYKKDLFENVCFPTGKLTEDEYTTYQLILKSKMVICLPKVIYYYRKREGSIVTSYSDRRFEVCNEVPALLKQALSEAGMLNYEELSYKSMRIWLKIYNDFVQGDAYDEYSDRLDELQSKICELKIDCRIWDKKYVLIKWMLSHMPSLYRRIVYRYRGV